MTITHAKVNNVANWTQGQLDAQIALGNFAVGTTLADITLAQDWNTAHVVTGITDRVISQPLHGFSVGQLVYLSGSTYLLASCINVVVAEVVGIVSVVTDANNFTIILSGYISTLSGLTAGTVYFLSSSGTLTSTDPSVANYTYVSKPLFVADSTTSGYFNNWRGIIDNVTAGYVPYTGAISNVDLNQKNLTNIHNLATTNNFAAGVLGNLPGTSGGYINFTYNAAGPASVELRSNDYNDEFNGAHGIYLNAEDGSQLYSDDGNTYFQVSLSAFYGACGGNLVFAASSTPDFQIYPITQINNKLNIIKTTGTQFFTGINSSNGWQSTSVSGGRTDFAALGATDPRFNFLSKVSVFITNAPQLVVGYDTSNFMRLDLSSTGNASFDVAATTTANAQFTFNKRVFFTDSVGTLPGNYITNYTKLVVNPAVDTAFYGTAGYFQIEKQGSVNCSGANGITSFQCDPVNSGAGTVSEMNGFYSKIRQFAGVITVGNQAKLGTPQIGGGTIGTLNGLYIEAQKVASVTTGYSINSIGANDIAYFAGTMGIGTNTPNSSLQVSGSLATAYRAITALRTLDATDQVIHCTANTFTVTLPTAVGISGRRYDIKNTGAGVITLATTSSQTIDGAAPTQTLAVNQSITVVATGANWIII